MNPTIEELRNKKEAWDFGGGWRVTSTEITAVFDLAIFLLEERIRLKNACRLVLNVNGSSEDYRQAASDISSLLRDFNE